MIACLLAVQLPIGDEADLTGLVDLVDMKVRATVRRADWSISTLCIELQLTI